jgi:hypothetical protein
MSGISLPYYSNAFRRASMPSTRCNLVCTVEVHRNSQHAKARITSLQAFVEHPN